MKKLIALFFAVAMLPLLSFGSTAFTPTTSAASTQVVRKSKRKGRYVVRRSWNGTKWVYRTTRVKTHSPRRKTWRTGRKVVSRTKKIFN